MSIPGIPKGTCHFKQISTVAPYQSLHTGRFLHSDTLMECRLFFSYLGKLKEYPFGNSKGNPPLQANWHCCSISVIAYRDIPPFWHNTSSRQLAASQQNSKLRGDVIRLLQGLQGKIATLPLISKYQGTREGNRIIIIAPTRGNFFVVEKVFHKRHPTGEYENSES
ncbi:hypothetical protein Nepgr_001138 [Nepenthes gracilis]|uniref:Uncharacterized protein n=1 Tax=Nepenthes gracilis TaxID=150966 RepID=A0AAD3RWR8_NEPGR|nr:hypothetical protein Nepgr_001138 [Nepenthes gracilis]